MRDAQPRVLVRNATDIIRLRNHLLTHWKRQGVEFSVDELPVVESQRAQDRFVRLSEGCNCLIGEMLGAMTALGGCFRFMTWASTRSWRDMALLVLATVCAVLVGKGIERAWVRVRMLLVLRRLRRRLAGEDFGQVVPAHVPVMSFRVEASEVVQGEIEPLALPKGRRGPRILLRNTADIDRLIPRLATHWMLPRIEIGVDTLPTLDVQRAQTRVVRLSAGNSYLFAALLAVATLLVGLLYEVWTESQEWFYSTREDWWLLKLDWNDVWPVAVATLCAGLIGAAAEAIWLRMRLLFVLRKVRRSAQIRESRPPPA